MGGSGDNDLEKEDKIIRKIAKEVTIDKTIEIFDLLKNWIIISIPNDRYNK